MASKVVICAFVASAVQMAFGQCLPQVLPACQQQIPVAYQPQIISQPALVAPPQTTVIQDSSVSNNLANALQLLVVSSLLSNTLPFNQAELVVPSCGQVLPVPSCGSVPSCGGIGQLVPSYGPVLPSCGGIGPVVSSYGPVLPSCGGFGQVISEQVYNPYITSVVSPSFVSAPVVPSYGCGGLGGLIGLY